MQSTNEYFSASSQTVIIQREVGSLLLDATFVTRLKKKSAYPLD